ncbi:MAG TPA: efflux transporter outer membrane subunit, partial [Bryobacteraceae bacterium]|nr:efflux transporter outer membrane subunit [Bryobacteraceae bacterium]
MNRRRSLVLLAILMLAFLSGCMVGPNYHRPQEPLPGQFRNAPPADGPASIADTKWVDLFHDDTLKQLVETALEKNFDVQIAAERVLEARAQTSLTRAQLFPTLDLPAQFAASQASAIGAFPFPSGQPFKATYTQLGLSLAWDLDLWGRIRRLTEAARAQYLATDEARHGVVLSLISDVMTSYFGLREQDLELEIAHQTRDAAVQSLRLMQLREQRGAASGLEVHQAEQFLYTATAQIASTERSIGQSENALSLLLGKAPVAITRGNSLEQIAGPPELPPGLPASLLERRPDIRQAEDNLIAANAQIGAARALFFPSVSLTGFLGGQSSALSALLTSPARMASISPAVTLPIFHAGLRAGLQLTEAQKQEMLVTYQKTIYTALLEVSDAL